VINNDNGPNMNRAVTERRKAVKRALHFDLITEELNLVSPPQHEDIPVRKRPRLEEPLPIRTDQTHRNCASPDVLVGLSPPTAENNNDANADPVKYTQQNTRVARAAARWTTDEDAELTSAVENTSKKKWGKEYKINWAAVAALVPSRTTSQCWIRWYGALDPRSGEATERTGKWTTFEDSMLKDALRTHYYSGWVAISALVPGKTRIQCRHRWNDVLDPNIDRVSGRTGKWTAVEDSKLEDAVQTHDDKDWIAISLLVPGRTVKQCCSRWRRMDPNRSTVRGK
jgi:hypothetical protein